MAAKVVEWVRQARSFLQDVQSEGKRVTWLGWKQTVAQTVVALIFIFVVAVYLGLVDVGLTRVINYVLSIRI